MASKTLKYRTEIRRGQRGGAFVVLPADIEAEFEGKSRVKVLVHFDGIEYRGSIARINGESIIGITKGIRSEIGKDIGDEIQVTLQVDTNERSVEVPTALDLALEDNANARANFDNLAFTYRKEFSKWITDAKKVETRERRLKKAIQMILNGDKL